MSKEKPSQDYNAHNPTIKLLDISKHDPETRFIKEEEIRKAFARVLLSNDTHLLHEAKLAIRWLNENQWLFTEEEPILQQDTNELDN